MLKNPIINILWHFFSLLSAVVAGFLVFAFFIFFGAGYELISCYINGHNDASSQEESSSFVFNESYLRKTNDINNVDNKIPLNYFIIFILVLAGIILQPFYLCFKILLALLECYKNYGCWFYLYASY